jgi:hypothetical protein
VLHPNKADFSVSYDTVLFTNMLRINRNIIESSKTQTRQSYCFLGLWLLADCLICQCWLDFQHAQLAKTATTNCDVLKRLVMSKLFVSVNGMIFRPVVIVLGQRRIQVVLADGRISEGRRS